MRRLILQTTNIVRGDSLILELDAKKTDSYPGTGTAWYDLSGSGNHATLVNGVTFNSGALIFNGTTQYAEVASNGFGKFNHQTHTVQFAAKFNARGNRTLFSYDYTLDSNPYYAIHLRQNAFNPNDSIFGSTNNGTTFSHIEYANASSILETWQIITYVRDVDRSMIYVNGVLNHTLVFGNITTTFYNQPVWIGKANFSSFMSGSISMALFYKRALTPNEVLQNFNVTKQSYGL